MPNRSKTTRSQPRTSPRPPSDLGEARAEHAVGFFRDCLTHSKGEWGGQAFALAPWQETLLRTIFGTLRPDGRRRYRRCYVEIAKKNGKSTLAAGIALYLLLGENEPGAEIYSCAADREQASIVFSLAKSMLEASPTLLPHVEIFRNAILRPATGGMYRVLSADVPTKHGINASGVIFDELHAQTSRALWDVMQGSTAARREPLTVELTTAGHDRSSICWLEHEYALGVKAGTIPDQTFLPVVYAAAPTDDWTSTDAWAKANPSLGITVRDEFLRAECQRAQRSPAYENAFKRYHCNLWTQQVSRWLPLDAWANCAERIEDDELVGCPAYAGLDLGQTDDFSSLQIVFLLPDGRVATRGWYWIPSDAITARPLRPYDVWRRESNLSIIQGAAIEYDAVEADVLAACRRYGVRELAYDARFAEQMAQHLRGEGLTLIDQPQGFHLNEALRKLLALTQTRTLAHGGDPVLAWMAGNMTVKTGTRGEIRAAKEHAAEKIDGIVALVMALGRLIRHEGQEGGSAYADHALFAV